MIWKIVGLKTFLKKNYAWLARKYPRIMDVYRNFSTEGFALAVYEELVVCLIISMIATFSYSVIIDLLWLGAFMACAVHFVIHIFFSVIIHKYIPALMTSAICLPISALIICRCVESMKPFSALHLCIMAIGFLLVFANLRLAQKLIGSFKNEEE